MSEQKVWLWKEPDRRWKENVLTHIKNIETDEIDIIVLHCMDLEGFSESIPLTHFILDVCERFGLFKNERTMFLNPKDLLQAIELCLGRLVSKNDATEIKVADEDLILCHKAYIEHFQCKNKDVSDKAVLSLKKFIEENNCADLWLINDKLFEQKINNCDYLEHLSHSKYLILGTPPSKVFLRIISLLTTKEVVLNVLVETPLNISLQGSPSTAPSSIEVTSELLEFKDISLDTESEAKLGSASKEYVQETIMSFLSLLLNSRNELALSKAMISPIIDLSHEAFTKLKHLSEEKEMPMCQTAISYATRVKLGGKGYAPASDCPMLPHLKKLELFVDTLNQMQTLIEEDLTPISAVKRLINILKKKLLKCGSDKLRTSSIETACENLKDIAAKVLKIQTKKASKTSMQVCQENLDFLYNFVNYVNCNCWIFDPKQILAVRQSKRTPISLPPLLGYFRSPEDESSCDLKSVLDEDSVVSNISVPPPQPISYFHHSESSSFAGTCVDTLTPSKMSFKGCLTIFDDNGSLEALEVPKPSKKKINSVKGRKRSILGEITNENPAEKMKKITEKKPVSAKQVEKEVKTKNKNLPKKETKTKVKGSKKFKLIEGQGRITNFFTAK